MSVPNSLTPVSVQEARRNCPELFTGLGYPLGQLSNSVIDALEDERSIFLYEYNGYEEDEVRSSLHSSFNGTNNNTPNRFDIWTGPILDLNGIEELPGFFDGQRRAAIVIERE